MAEPDYYPPTLTSVLLTDRERRIVFRSLTMAAAMMDALGEQLGAALALELADRILADEELQ